MKSIKSLILFTQSYPYTEAAEHSFLKNEIPLLIPNFEQIILVPKSTKGEKINLPKGIILDETLAIYLNNRRRYKKIFKRMVYYNIIVEIINKPQILFKFKFLYKYLKYLIEMCLVNDWFNKSKYYKNHNILIYTYWFTSITSNFALNDKYHKIITRVHGIDLYEERNDGYIPMRKGTLAKLDRVYCVSEASKNYLSEKYPEYSSKYRVARLGVKKTSVNVLPRKKDHIFRVVSCSSLIPIKRVDLIIEGIYKFAEENKNIKIIYQHFGDGILREKIKNIIIANKLSNLTISLEGYVENERLLEFYANNYVDVFINLSSSEGGCPVTMQEAQCFGIPCIGTNVGGIPEIIKDNTGILLPVDISLTEVSDALKKILDMDTQTTEKYRKSSHLNWKYHFNSEVNFNKFIREIVQI